MRAGRVNLAIPSDMKVYFSTRGQEGSDSVRRRDFSSPRIDDSIVVIVVVVSSDVVFRLVRSVTEKHIFHFMPQCSLGITGSEIKLFHFLRDVSLHRYRTRYV